MLAQFTQPNYPKDLTPNEMLSNNDIRSSWVGGGFNSYYTGAAVGDEFYIAGSEFPEIETGDQITKVKFFHELGIINFESGNVEFTNTQYTIKIYENPTLSGPYAAFGFYSTAIGTPVYTQSVTLGAEESGQAYELTLSTPYTVTDNDFWVAICFDNGKGAMRLGSADPSSDGKYYMYRDGSAYGAGIVIGKPNFGSISVPEYYPLGISLFIDDGTPYEEHSDLTVKYLDTYPGATQYISDVSITDSEDLIIYPVIFNNGTDATSNNATISATIDGSPFMSETSVDLSGFYSLPNGYYTTIAPGGSFTITAAEMTNLNLSGIFDICFTVTYSGIDPASANNTVCLTVTRGEIALTNCDMESLFITSNTDYTPITGSVSIDLADDITVFPAVKNNGPDEANNTANIIISVAGNDVDNQDVNLNGLQNGQILPVTESGTTLTAAVMDLAGLTGSFDICMTVTYNGTDADAGNNTTCLTVNRTSVGVNDELRNNIGIFPNPANDLITITNAENANIVIVNMVGSIVANVENASANQTIDISNLTNGTYFVRVKAEVFKFSVVK